MRIKLAINGLLAAAVLLISGTHSVALGADGTTASYRLPDRGEGLIGGFGLHHRPRLDADSAEQIPERETSLAKTERFFFVLGDVPRAQRYRMTSATTLLGAIAMAGGSTRTDAPRQVVVFRRGENRELLSTMLELPASPNDAAANEAGEIYIRDGDVIVVPNEQISDFDDFVRQVFVEGVYGLEAVGGFYKFSPEPAVADRSI